MSQMKLVYQDLLNFLNEKPSKKVLSDKLFQLGHEHEIHGDIFDMELTPNRGDCLSLIGLARDLNVFFVISYTVEIYKDKDTRDDEEKEQSMRISNRHLQHFKTNYDITTSTNPIALAYADLKTNSQLSNIADVTE